MFGKLGSLYLQTNTDKKDESVEKIVVAMEDVDAPLRRRRQIVNR